MVALADGCARATRVAPRAKSVQVEVIVRMILIVLAVWTVLLEIRARAPREPVLRVRHARLAPSARPATLARTETLAQAAREHVLPVE